jgi:transposase-like protein
MAPKKLTEADKTSILSLYRQPQETTSTLADRYGVSNSTISRLLKSNLPEAEYSLLIQQKRGTPEKAGTEKNAIEDMISAPAESAPAVPKAKPRGRKKAEVAPVPSPATEPSTEDASPVAADLPPVTPKAKPRSKKQVDAQPATAIADSEAESSSLQDLPPAAIEEAAAKPVTPARRRRSKSASLPDAEAADSPEALDTPDPVDPTPEPTQLTLPDPEPAPTKPARPVLKSAQPSVPETLEAETGLSNGDEAEGDDWDSPVLGDDYDDDDGDDGDDDGENIYPWDGVDSPTERLHHHGGRSATETLEISPLTADVLPSLCYVVVERTSSDLVVLPLRTFAELGQIPESEGESQTLPVFENHNVARRFSRRNQRVVKVPDGTLLQTTSAYLQAKGITRLFIDGQVFSLDSDPAEPLVTAAEE